ncbi:MAG: hypothetical protein K6A30_09820 [Lachnospiraceae bacterium]|nr:hypothetical protein [Lachnospiraceae bacterium]
MKNNYTMTRKIINDADALLITASNGLSIAEGYHIFADNEDFKSYFGTYREKYGIDCLIRGVFTPMFLTDKESYMHTVHKYLIDDYTPRETMKNLLNLVINKDYFVLTSNGDTHFQLCGFHPDKIFEIEGNFDGLEEMSSEWQMQQHRFQQFLSKHKDKKLVLLELGIGAQNQIIKAPTMKLVEEHKNWFFITLNMAGQINILDSIKHRSITIKGDISDSLKHLLTTEL